MARPTTGSQDLIERWQRGFPLVARPYGLLGESTGLTEDGVIQHLHQLKDLGVLSRVGATVRPNTVGASTLGAMHVPPHRLQSVADCVSAEATVNHNYEREHHFNLWFVVTAGDGAAVARALQRLGAATGIDILDLPLERSYFIDLGFSLSGRRQVVTEKLCAPDFAIEPADRDLLRVIEDGLPLVAEPYAAIARRLGVEPDQVMKRLARLIAGGIVTRFGLIVRHRELGFTANAMAVWDVPDANVDRIGSLMAANSAVTLCYRRPRRLPHWPYNLFCMVHGRERGTVTDEVGRLTREAGLCAHSNTLLFSRRCFKQRGATLSAS